MSFPAHELVINASTTASTKLCLYCKQEYTNAPAFARLHQQSFNRGAMAPDCVNYPCTCLPHQGPLHAAGCPRSTYWNRDIDRRLNGEVYE